MIVQRSGFAPNVSRLQHKIRQTAARGLHSKSDSLWQASYTNLLPPFGRALQSLCSFSFPHRPETRALREGAQGPALCAMRALRKRIREGASDAGDTCPVCLEEFDTSRTKTEPFQCAHGVCSTCHARLLGEDDNRCPVCRAPRNGFTAEQAEPHPDRNHPPPTLADALADLGIEVVHEEFNRRGPGLATGAARGYGGFAGLAVRPPAPTMFFPIDPAPSLPLNSARHATRYQLEQTMQRLIQGSAPRMPVDLLGVAMRPEDVRTLLDFGASEFFSTAHVGLDAAAVRALIDVPSTPLSEWNARHRTPAAPARNSRTTGQRGRRVATLTQGRRRAP